MLENVIKPMFRRPYGCHYKNNFITLITLKFWDHQGLQILWLIILIFFFKCDHLVDMYDWSFGKN